MAEGTGMARSSCFLLAFRWVAGTERGSPSTGPYPPAWGWHEQHVHKTLFSSAAGATLGHARSIPCACALPFEASVTSAPGRPAHFFAPRGCLCAQTACFQEHLP